MSGENCILPPPGWRCTRGRHVDGPCAAVPVESRIERLKAALWVVIDDLENTVDCHEPDRGGQHVTKRYPLGQQTPSGLQRMRRLARDLRSALRDEWPMIREEYAEGRADLTEEDLDTMFPKRKP